MRSVTKKSVPNNKINKKIIQNKTTFKVKKAKLGKFNEQKSMKIKKNEIDAIPKNEKPKTGNKRKNSNNKTSEKVEEQIEDSISNNPQKNIIINNHKLNVNRLKQLIDNKQNNKKKKITKETSESLRDKMMNKLRASRFRFLNEQLYENQSWISKKFFKDDPNAFEAYHHGYRQQTEQWPLNPLDVIISSIKKLPEDFVIADFGCGEAKLAASVSQKVHSIDHIAINDNVTACDMAHTSLLTNSVNVVVFCLSLMGSNLSDYLIEANRILKKDGILKIAEVESRFENINQFIKQLSDYGFKNTWKDLSHNLFYFIDFKKQNDISDKRKKLSPITLKTCLYKKR